MVVCLYQTISNIAGVFSLDFNYDSIYLYINGINYEYNILQNISILITVHVVQKQNWAVLRSTG